MTALHETSMVAGTHEMVSISRSFTPKLIVCVTLVFLAEVSSLRAQDHSFVVNTEDRSIVVEPYAPNIVRITLATDKRSASAAPGYGIIGTPAIAGWTKKAVSGKATAFGSDQLEVKGSLDQPPHSLPLDSLNQALREPYFGGGPSRHGFFHDTVLITGSDGKALVTLPNWSMVPNTAETARALAGTRQEGPAYRIFATFASPTSEHYDGLGQQQGGTLDLRDHQIKCWHDYSAIASTETMQRVS